MLMQSTNAQLQYTHTTIKTAAKYRMKWMNGESYLPTSTNCFTQDLIFNTVESRWSQGNQNEYHSVRSQIRKLHCLQELIHLRCKVVSVLECDAVNSRPGEAHMVSKLLPVLADVPFKALCVRRPGGPYQVQWNNSAITTKQTPKNWVHSIFTNIRTYVRNMH